MSDWEHLPKPQGVGDISDTRTASRLDVVAVSGQMEQIYGVLSDVSHVRRSGLRGVVSAPLRRAVYRAHPDPVARAHATVSTVLGVEATILGAGDALAAFYGGPYYAQIIKPIQDGLMAGHQIERRRPLGEQHRIVPAAIAAADGRKSTAAESRRTRGLSDARKRQIRGTRQPKPNSRSGATPRRYIATIVSTTRRASPPLSSVEQ